ncbi:WD40 repeat-like protein [Gonapodya prolifera JEL478]|uniref:WD repeat-containing protein JIP5 n=1 Tax=Gonapodya prolifera (strain JEL478) TaxID=1344416 RepID=A0A139AQS3_GONPJ|nr:WD40 repeat-like protein [Gonapodya prolifera JEL478]|eukprot:KXS18853.1 WD40 repeat-like protein [Gonapodya prolifera JEL478]
MGRKRRENTDASIDGDAEPPIPNLTFPAQVFDLAFHPTKDILAVGLLTGHLACYRYSDGATSELYNVKQHKKSCRSIGFSHDGTGLYSASKDKSLLLTDVETGKVLGRKKDAHESPVNILLTLSETMIATGDDDGTVKLWDTRTFRSSTSSSANPATPSSDALTVYKDNDDFISSMHYVEHKKHLIVTGGDGFLSVFDIRKPTILARSDNQEDELLCVTVVKGFRKAVVGTQSGVLDLFTYGRWGDVSDRFPGHPGSIDCITSLSDDCIVTGCSDGIIRILSILPNKLLGVVGAHDDGFGVERLRVDHSGRLMATTSVDEEVRFWDVGWIVDGEGDEDGDDDEDEDSDEGKEGVEGEDTAGVKADYGDDAREGAGSDSDDESDLASEGFEDIEDESSEPSDGEPEGGSGLAMAERSDSSYSDSEEDDAGAPSSATKDGTPAQPPPSGNTKPKPIPKPSPLVNRPPPSDGSDSDSDNGPAGKKKRKRKRAKNVGVDRMVGGKRVKKGGGKGGGFYDGLL